MKWVTRRTIRVNRTATASLVRRFVLRAIWPGIPLVAKDDHEIVERASDALYAALGERLFADDR